MNVMMTLDIVDFDENDNDLNISTTDQVHTIDGITYDKSGLNNAQIIIALPAFRQTADLNLPDQNIRLLFENDADVRQFLTRYIGTKRCRLRLVEVK